MNSKDIKPVIEDIIKDMSNTTAKEMIVTSMTNDETIEDFLLSLRTGVVVASISLTPTEENKRNKELALTAVTNDINRFTTIDILKEDIATAVEYINTNYVSGEVNWQE